MADHLWDDLDEDVKLSAGGKLFEWFRDRINPTMDLMGMSQQGIVQFYRWFGRELVEMADGFEPVAAAADALEEQELEPN